MQDLPKKPLGWDERDNIPIDPIDALDQPPLDRYCDLVLQGGVVDGVVYPGLLVELARKFRFRSVGGTSVGAIAACLAVACEYRRRFNDSPEGFNEGLAKLPETLSEIVDQTDPNDPVTRIRSLFQPEPQLAPLFHFLVDWLSSPADDPLAPPASAEADVIRKSLSPSFLWRSLMLLWKHMGPNLWETIGALLVGLSACMLLWVIHALLGGHMSGPLLDYLVSLQVGILIFPFTFLSAFFICAYLVLPLRKLSKQLRLMTQTMGYGLCSGLASDSKRPALIEWLFKGVQDAAGMPYHQPLTFADLWQAPCGPAPAYLGQPIKSIDLAVVSSCLSHGRIYEVPSKDPTAKVLFRLSEFSKYFPKEVIDHLRLVSKSVDQSSDVQITKLVNEIAACTDPVEQLLMQKRLLKLGAELQKPESSSITTPDIRELPSADLPIVVAARLSFAVPVLFQALPLLGLSLDQNLEDSNLVRLWFSDGGIGSNIPVQLFDKALPRWPTFSARIVNASPFSQSKKGRPFVPFSHLINANDTLIEPLDTSGYTRPSKMSDQGWDTFGKFLLGIYETAKNGGDKAFFRAPEVRGRIVKIYTNNKTEGALNLKLRPRAILELGRITGVLAGQKLAYVYLSSVPDPNLAWVDGWRDHRWVRLHSLINGLKTYLQGFTYAVDHPFDGYSLLQQIQDATQSPALKSESGGDPNSKITAAQAAELKAAILAITNLETSLGRLSLPQPYSPVPQSSLQSKPRV